MINNYSCSSPPAALPRPQGWFRTGPPHEGAFAAMNSRTNCSRRDFLQNSALGVVAVATGLGAPAVLRAQGASVKVGVLHPVSGALSYSGRQGRLGAAMAIEDVNAAGGIKALGGAKIEALLGDAQSTPEGGNAEVEKMNAAGVAAIVGGYASSICLSASQTAARYDLPYLVDVGVVDSIVTRGLKNTFRFGPGFGVIAKTALDNLVAINDQAGKAAKTALIVHEDSAFGAGLAKLLNAQLPERGFQVLETIPHPTPQRDFNNVALKIRTLNPDLVIPANYYNEYVLLARTMQQQRVRPKAIYSVLGGAASSYKFVKEFPEAAQYIIDCNHWFDPRNPGALALKKKVESMNEFYTYEVFMNYSCVLLLADAIERAASADRAKIIAALETSTFGGHLMPYGPTKFVNGQNEGAAPVNTQVIGNDIKVIFPASFASAAPVFPMPRA
jgi:branched-chain amino acid transport system substrate-binding protein